MSGPTGAYGDLTPLPGSGRLPVGGEADRRLRALEQQVADLRAIAARPVDHDHNHIWGWDCEPQGFVRGNTYGDGMAIWQRCECGARRRV